jgi:lipopolysaccharide biosynthesis glycosyltransferase
MSTIHVVNAANEPYVPHTAAMLHSLFATNPGETFAVHFVHAAGFGAEHAQRLANLCARHGASFTATAVAPERLGGLPIAGHFPQEAWYRVLLPQLLPQLERALWLDSDVLVRAPIRELWQLDLGGLPLAACPNAVLYTFAGMIGELGVADRHRYFNSGVMLLNLRQMREENSEAALRAAAKQHASRIRFADQDVLNVVYHARYRRLPLAWNVIAHAHVNVPETIRVHGLDEYREAMARPRIVHFTGLTAMKPWFHRCSHPQREEYLRHRALAGWPPPAYPDRSAWTGLTRRLPLRLRTVLATFVRGKHAEMLSYLRPW